ncbi:MAG: GNAT family N-acetyltransferase [Pyrinomonadaceae bacterium]|nr:GNAT family N-acetyltransferase [Sphingobacteriaceae bacterium]
MYSVRKAISSDYDRVFKLYKTVAAGLGEFTRIESEITEDYVGYFFSRSLEQGIELVIANPENEDELIAEIHCYKPGQIMYLHILQDTVMAVHPDYQGKGFGKMLWNSLLTEILYNRRDVLRLELIIRETNYRTITYYKSLDFKIEGRFDRRVDSGIGKFEADIPMCWFNPNFENNAQP